MYTSKLKELYTTFLHAIKPFGYRMAIKLDKVYLAVEQNNYAANIVNVYTVYELGPWPKVTASSSNLKIVCLVRKI